VIDRAGVERLFLPFVALQVLSEAAVAAGRIPARLREVVTAGEQLRITLAIRAFFAALPDSRLDNQYGPTESHVATAHLLGGDPARWPDLPPIGRPIANVRTHLLDATMRPAPPGAAADLWIAGDCLADGYWRQPELTGERFRTLDIDGRAERAYKSGDRARYLPDGSIEFLGRGDDQLKVRGYRVEPGEIEAAIEGHPGVRQAAVVARQQGESPVLAAFFVRSDRSEVTLAALREYLHQILPEYLVPATFTELESMPTTPSGKIDRRRLPLAVGLAEAPAEGVTDSVAPRDDVERRLVEIWSEVLGNERVGVSDDFFALGGHSLLAGRIVTRVGSALAVEITFAELFEHPTIDALARLIRPKLGQPASTGAIGRAARRTVPGSGALRSS
jgi:acyl-coenzyme A synthetase/AMP-(fatty) acid ligase